MLAADTLASYGSLARFKDVTRLNTIGEHTILGAGGEFSDFQAIGEMLQKLDQEDKNADDGFAHSPAELFHYLRAIFYSKRNKFNPLWNEVREGGRGGGWEGGEGGRAACKSLINAFEYSRSSLPPSFPHTNTGAGRWL